MAIINSTAIGKGTKTAGQLTYRNVRGRVIASQRITSNKSNTPAQATQRLSFKEISQALSKISFLINRTFEKSKYGSSRNNFYKINKDALASIEDLAVKQSPFEIVDSMVRAKLPYMIYGSGNGSVSVLQKDTGDLADNPNVAMQLKITAFDVKSGDCKATMFELTASGEFTVSDITSSIQYDAETMTASIQSEGGMTTERVYQFIVLETPLGIVKNPIIATKTVSGN